jgi:hypothetical protein
MAWRLANLGELASGPLNPAAVESLLKTHTEQTLPRLNLMWSYYRNPMEPAGGWSIGRAAGRAYRLAQERGLPPRLTGRPSGHGLLADDRAAARREIVIENDIAWRLHAMIDFLFGKPIRLVSTAADPQLARRIERALDNVWEASGGAAMLQDAALLGHVHGHVDLIVRAAPELSALAAERAGALTAERAGALTADAIDDRIRRLAPLIRIEPVPATRGVPIVNAEDYRRLDGYIIRVQQPGAAPEAPGLTRYEVLSPSWRQVYEDRGEDSGPRLIDEGENTVSPGSLPVVHVQNVSQPLAFSGLSEVEPLIPLQDELNTRLSDRASRVTMQSFKMYLAKGVEGFDRAPIAPGQVWATDNLNASIDTFGGDASSPSEDTHIEQIREALDKSSSVPPLATGVVRARVGNLSSENALRLTLQGLLTRTERKRLLYGRGIIEASRLALEALEHAGVLRTSAGDRRVMIEWPDPISRDRNEELAAAKSKRELGVSAQRVLSELGYGPADGGVQ